MKSVEPRLRANRIYQEYAASLGYKVLSLLQGGSRVVYQVEKEGMISILKIAREPSHKRKTNQLERENKALSLASGIPRVAAKISYHENYFKNKKLLALVREYIEGPTLTEASSKLDQKQYSLLEETVGALHQRGISSLDLCSDNIIITPDKIPYVIDLGLADLRPEVGRAWFQSNVEEDLFELESLFP